MPGSTWRSVAAARAPALQRVPRPPARFVQAGAPSRAVPPRTIALLAIGTALLTGLVAWEGNGVAGLALAGSRAVRPPRDWAPLLGLLRGGRPGAWLERGAAVLEKAAPAALLAGVRREARSGDAHPLLRRQLRPAAGADAAGAPGGEVGALLAGRGGAAGTGTGAAAAAARQQAAARALPSGRGAAAGGRARGTRSPADAAGALAAALAYTRPGASDDAAGGARADAHAAPTAGASAAPEGAAARRTDNGTQQHSSASGASAAALGEPAAAAAGAGAGTTLAPPTTPTPAASGAGGGGQLADPGPDPGRCAFLAASADEPLGPPAGAGNPLCTPLRRPGVRSVAVVGNGPLDEAARRGVGAADIVVRFNLMNNWRRFAERVDVWVIRFSVEAALRYWGITNFRPAEGERVINATQARPAALVRAGWRLCCALDECWRAGRGRMRAPCAAARVRTAGTTSACSPACQRLQAAARPRAGGLAGGRRAGARGRAARARARAARGGRHAAQGCGHPAGAGHGRVQRLAGRARRLAVDRLCGCGATLQLASRCGLRRSASSAAGARLLCSAWRVASVYLTRLKRLIRLAHCACACSICIWGREAWGVGGPWVRPPACKPPPRPRRHQGGAALRAARRGGAPVRHELAREDMARAQDGRRARALGAAGGGRAAGRARHALPRHARVRPGRPGPELPLGGRALPVHRRLPAPLDRLHRAAGGGARAPPCPACAPCAAARN